MPSAKSFFSRIPNGGFNRAALPHALGNQDFYDLLQLRPVIGGLEQTAPVGTLYNMSLLTGEGAATQCHYIDVVRNAAQAIRYLVVNETNARYTTADGVTETLIPSILQTAIPNNTTVNGYCLLYGFNTTDFAAAADTIDVKISSATQFQWRRNGGAYSAAVNCASEVAIGANGLKVSFAATSGFTINDTWTWTRGNTIPWDSTTGLANLVNTNYRLDNYLGGVGRTVLRVRDGFITSVGYRRIYGRYVAVLQNHLVVAHFAEGKYDAVTGVDDDNYSVATTPWRVAYSDLNNPDQFFATDTNEADGIDVPYNTYPDNGNVGITGVEPLRDGLMLYQYDSMHEMTYVGLPNVMQVNLKFSGVGCAFSRGLVNAKRGHYFISRDNFYFYDGTTPVPIGEPVRSKVFGEMLDPTDTNYNKLWSYYDAARQEVVWCYFIDLGSSKYGMRQVVFQERYNRWFFRNIPTNDTNSNSVGSMLASTKHLRYLSGSLTNSYWTSESRVYVGKGKILVDGDQGNAVKDTITTGSASFTQPLVETNDLIYDEVFFLKETDGFYIDANWDANAVMDGVTLSYQFRRYLTDTVTLTALGTLWTRTTVGRRLGIPRTSGVIARFRMTFTGTIPYGCKLYAYGDFIYGRGRQLEQ